MASISLSGCLSSGLSLEEYNEACPYERKYGVVLFIWKHL